MLKVYWHCIVQSPAQSRCDDQIEEDWDDERLLFQGWRGLFKMDNEDMIAR